MYVVIFGLTALPVMVGIIFMTPPHSDNELYHCAETETKMILCPDMAGGSLCRSTRCKRWEINECVTGDTDD